MSRPPRQFKFSGMISPHDALHVPIAPSTPAAPSDEQYIAPTIVDVTIVSPASQAGTLKVPQYSDTVVGGPAAGYNPAGDCGGNFMSYKYQPNNNCYAYGCNITPNTFPQPGRHSGYLLPWPFNMSVQDLGALVSSYAEKDGLQLVGQTWAELKAFQTNLQQGPAGTVVMTALPGHFVALMVSPAGTDSNWPGDYHWARCDDSNGECRSWSQKDGNDQVTNFDFAGNPITDPSSANWTVNQGPITPLPPLPPPPPFWPPYPPVPQPPKVGEDMVAEYMFYCFMYVPETGVNII